MAEKEEDVRLPVACALPPAELRLRAEELRSGIARRVTATRELENGLAIGLALSPESLAEAEAFVDFERRCCGFATFELRRDEASDVLWIEIRGPEGTKGLFEDLVAKAAREPE